MAKPKLEFHYYATLKGPNLKTRLGSVYRITKDPAWVEEDRGSPDRDWLYTIPCRRGGKISGIKSNIYQHGHQRLGFIGMGVKLRRELLKIEGVTSHQRGDKEFSVVFDASVFPLVAKVVEPRLKRRAAKSKEGVENALIEGNSTRPEVSGSST